jgi:hypothetical protein
MRIPLAGVFGALYRPNAIVARETLPGKGRSGPTIAELIAALDDRDVTGALELLDPPASGTAVTPKRRIKCAGGCKE